MDAGRKLDCAAVRASLNDGLEFLGDIYRTVRSDRVDSHVGDVKNLALHRSTPAGVGRQAEQTQGHDRDGKGSGVYHMRSGHPGGPAQLAPADLTVLYEFAVNPSVGPPQPLFQADLRFPTQRLTKPGVIAVPPPDSLRFGQVVTFDQLLTCDLRYDIDQVVDRDHPILAEIERFAIFGFHQSVDAFDAVIDVAIGPRL